MSMFRRDSDRGVTLTEFAVLLPLLLILAIGAFEYGMMFRDSLSVSTAAREGARVAASSANYLDSDCVILEATAGALQSFENGTIDEVHIYKSDTTGAKPGLASSTMRRYRPAQPGDVGLLCGGEWFPIHLGSSWDPADRVNDPGNADWIGVDVEYTHDFTLDLLWFSGTQSLSDDAVFRIEPPAP